MRFVEIYILYKMHRMATCGDQMDLSGAVLYRRNSDSVSLLLQNSPREGSIPTIETRRRSGLVVINVGQFKSTWHIHLGGKSSN